MSDPVPSLMVQDATRNSAAVELWQECIAAGTHLGVVLDCPVKVLLAKLVIPEAACTRSR